MATAGGPMGKGRRWVGAVIRGSCSGRVTTQTCEGRTLGAASSSGWGVRLAGETWAMQTHAGMSGA